MRADFVDFFTNSLLQKRSSFNLKEIAVMGLKCGYMKLCDTVASFVNILTTRLWCVNFTKSLLNFGVLAYLSNLM